MSFDFSLIPTATLFTMMLAMGMGLRASDFGRLVRSPLPVGFGLLAQLVLLPTVAFAIGRTLAPSPSVAIGLILIAACPGGVTSNALTHYARGDVALSISLTALSSAVAWLTIPLVVGLGFRTFVGPGANVALSPVETMTTLFTTTAVPILLGMGVLRLWPERAIRLARPLLLGSTCVLMLLVGGLGVSLARSETDVVGLLSRSLLPISTLMLVMAGVGLLGARRLGLSAPQARTIVLEVGIQNFNLAMVLALTLLEEPEFFGPALVYLPVMLVFGLAFVAWARSCGATRRKTRPLDAIVPYPTEKK